MFHHLLSLPANKHYSAFAVCDRLNELGEFDGDVALLIAHIYTQLAGRVKVCFSDNSVTIVRVSA